MNNGGAFEYVPREVTKRLVKVWKSMTPQDKEHFVNQVALALSMWGDDVEGRKMVAKVLIEMMNDGSMNLADFGIYVRELLRHENEFKDRLRKIRKAMVILDSYRLRYDLPSIPQKEIV